MNTTTSSIACSMVATDQKPAGARQETHYRRACEALGRSDFATAAVEAMASTMENNQSPVAHYLAGVAFLKLGLIDSAELAFLEAVKLCPAYSEAHLKLAFIYGRHRLDYFRLGEHRQLVAKAKAAGVDIAEGARLQLDADQIRHAFKRHGASEIQGDQRPIS